MIIDLSSVIVAVATVITTGIFGVVAAYMRGINDKLQSLLIRNEKHNTIIESHVTQFRDIWNKIDAIEKHFEYTDRLVEKNRKNLE